MTDRSDHDSDPAYDLPGAVEARWLDEHGRPASWREGDSRDDLKAAERGTLWYFRRPFHWVRDATGTLRSRPGRSPGDLTIEYAAAQRMLAEFDQREQHRD